MTLAHCCVLLSVIAYSDIARGTKSKQVSVSLSRRPTRLSDPEAQPLVLVRKTFHKGGGESTSELVLRPPQHRDDLIYTFHRTQFRAMRPWRGVGPHLLSQIGSPHLRPAPSCTPAPSLTLGFPLSLHLDSGEVLGRPREGKPFPNTKRGTKLACAPGKQRTSGPHSSGEGSI